MNIAVVNWKKCNGCGDCLNACPVKCFTIAGGKCLAERAAECIDCGNCPDICPSGALAVAIGWGG